MSEQPKEGNAAQQCLDYDWAVPSLRLYMKKLLFMLVLLLTSNTSNAELTGNVRKDFLDTNVRSCYATQKAIKFNQNIEGKLLYQYCKCNMLYVAEKLNNELLISIENGDQKMSPQLIQMAANYCQNNYQKYQ